MALYYNLSGSLYDEKDLSKQELVNDFYQRSIEQTQTLWWNANTDTRFYNGDQNVFQEVFPVPAHRNKYLSFNNIRPIIEMPAGYQIKNRKSTIAIPVENQDQEFTDQLTELLMWNSRTEGLPNMFSDAFHGALVTGLNFIQLWMDYRNDPISGDLRFNHLHYNEVIIDPYFKKLDLSDCNGILKRSYNTKATLKSIFPKKAELIDSLGSESKYDDRFQFMPEAYQYNKSNLFAMDEFYYRDYRPQTLIVDVDTGLSYEWKGSNNANLRQFLKMFPQLVLKKSSVPTVKMVTMVNGKILYEGDNDLGIDEYPFIPIVGYFSPQSSEYSARIQGMVRGLRDAQFIYNRRKAIELDVAESQIQTGFFFKPGSLIDPQDVYKVGQGKHIGIKDTAQIADIQQIPSKDVPQSFFQLSQGLQEEMLRMSGVTAENLGSASDDIPGILSMLRQGAGMTTLQRLFDNLDYAQKLLGTLQAKAMIKNFSPQKIKRITGKEAHPYFQNETAVDFDVAIEEGFDTTTQKQLQFAQMVQMKQAGVPIPDSAMLEAATIQNKSEIVKQVQDQQQQQQQAEQQRQQLEMIQLQAQIKMAEAQATADQGLGIERLSRVQENQQMALERSAKAEENRAAARREEEQGILNMAKALKELDSVQIENFRKLLDVAQLYSQFSDEQHSKDMAASMQQQYLEQQLQSLQSEAQQKPTAGQVPGV
jgi:hypothetical protein